MSEMNSKSKVFNDAQSAAAEPRRALVRKLRAQGLTWTAIGDLLGVSRARACQLGRWQKGAKGG